MADDEASAKLREANSPGAISYGSVRRGCCAAKVAAIRDQAGKGVWLQARVSLAIPLRYKRCSPSTRAEGGFDTPNNLLDSL